jgi:uncharacterized membrane protein YhiD involved in acid resistance
MSRGKIYLLIFVVAAFFVGTGYGVYVMSIPANNSSVAAITVTDSAFPAVNNTTTNQTNKTTTKNTNVVTKNTNTASNKSTTPTKKTNSTG